jgi:hypothetical protein
MIQQTIVSNNIIIQDTIIYDDQEISGLCQSGHDRFASGYSPKLAIQKLILILFAPLVSFC